MASFEKAVRKYLASRSEPEIALAPGVEGRWSHVLVVPACREEPSALDGVRPALGTAAGRVLVILVINGEEGDAASAEQNGILLGEFCATGSGRPIEVAGASGFLVSRADLDLLVIDRATPGRGLPAKRGVGLARKIGTDVALALWADGRIESPWLHASDADAVQPADRFSVAPSEGVVALWHPFVHEESGDPDVDRALSLYDLSLRYYMNGLAWAGSPWSFPTIGSTMTFRADAYAAVRGYPRREAGEDFYLLNKLAKVGRVERASTGPVRLRGRTSDRVPFGTGAGVAKILRESAAGEPFRLYHPASFVALRCWQESLAADRVLKDVRWAGEPDVADAGEAALSALGVREALAPLPRHGWQPWFDAFRTLRFLHEVRDAGFPKLEWRQALRLAARFGIPETDYPELDSLESGTLRRNPTIPPPISPAQSIDIATNAPGPRPEIGK